MKPLFVISCPIDCFAGYGARSRDIVKALLKTNKYDIKILPQRWGSTSLGFLKADNPEHKQILDCILPQLQRQPDVWMQISVPNEFQSIGKFNIGVTAGIETTMCDVSWIEGLNRMNLNLVSSEHAKSVFISSKFEARNKTNNQVEKIIELTSPIEILFEGVDTEIYKHLEKVSDNELNKEINLIHEEFSFLFVGHWLQGNLGEDRKNVGMLIKTFLETFKNTKNKPALILKTQGATASIIDKTEIEEKIRKIQGTIDSTDLPNVYLLHGTFSDSDINELYNHPKVKVHISFTKGEGFGRPLLEASLSKKPMITSNWSGHIDFLHKDMSNLLEGKITQIHPSAVINNMLIPESGWFTIDYKAASDKIKDVHKNYKNYLEKSKRQAYRSRNEFNLDKMGELLDNITDPKIPKPVQLKLPALKHIKLPTKDEKI
jgi:glycosyltransferase involved in cell wall biosynthesis